MKTLWYLIRTNINICALEKYIKRHIFKFEKVCLENSKEVILGITIDNKLTFKSHIKSIFLKAGQKMSALSKISPFLEKNKRETYGEVKI